MGWINAQCTRAGTRSVLVRSAALAAVALLLFVFVRIAVAPYLPVTVVMPMIATIVLGTGIFLLRILLRS